MFKDFLTCYYKINEIYKFKEYTLKRAFMYLLLLTFIFGSIQGYLKINRINKQFNKVINTMSSWNFRIQDGNFIIEDSPKQLDINDVTIYFSSGSETLNLDSNRNYIVIKDKNIMAYFNGSEANLPNLDFQTLSKDEFLYSLNSVNIILDVFYFILTLILFFIGKMVSAYFIAGFNNSIPAKIMNYKFIDLYKLSFYVMTLAVTIQTIFYALGFDMFLSLYASIVFVFVSYLMLKLVLQYEFKSKHI